MRKTLFGLLLFSFVFMAAVTYSQGTVVAQRQPANEKYIPKIVLTTFNLQYPNMLESLWFTTYLTYWYNDYSSDWYYGWYGSRTVVIYTYQKPNYYEVEFRKFPDEVSRAIYNIYGYWYETRTQIRGLPLAIHEVLKASKYKDWKISPVMERMESPMWPVEIFRFQVSKGFKSQILRMDSAGNIVQIKDLKE
jgi:hypothetical protein